jgi:hypothetical protein
LKKLTSFTFIVQSVQAKILNIVFSPIAAAYGDIFIRAG